MALGATWNTYTKLSAESKTQHESKSSYSFLFSSNFQEYTYFDWVAVLWSFQEDFEKCLWNHPFPVILTKANSWAVYSLKGTFSNCVSLPPILTFCSKSLAFHSYAEDFIYPLVHRVPTLNPRAKRTDMQDSGQKVLFSTLVGWFAWTREFK